MNVSGKKILKEFLFVFAATVLLESVLLFFKLFTIHDIINGIKTFNELPEIWTSIPPNVKLITFLLSSITIFIIIKYFINSLKEKKELPNVISIEELNSLKIELESKKKLLNTLGIIGLTGRKDTPITSVSESIKKSYNWVGLSAINELGPGAADNTEILESRLADNIKLCYTILSPDDKLRIKQSAIWENHDPLEIGKHIKLSIEKLNYLKNHYEHQVSYHFASRIPWLRVTKIDNDHFHVAHYDKYNLDSDETNILGFGCGFTGSILLISNENTNGKEPLLFTWINDFLLVEKQNILIDDLYAAVSREYCVHKNKKKIIEILLSKKYMELNNNFNIFFKWYNKNPQLRNEEINFAIEYVEKRYGLSSFQK